MFDTQLRHESNATLRCDEVADGTLPDLEGRDGQRANGPSWLCLFPGRASGAELKIVRCWTSCMVGPSAVRIN